ncbi:MAG: amino acid ABC transporter ATP-binding protein [Chlamydiae bacterium]|nr:amino acid ABC transporter ATP-binding protein [Chlamydiota bacterium]
MLIVKELSLLKKREGKEIPILNKISFEASKGRIFLLLGKSGSGKSSLLRCLAQLEKEYQGTISYKNQKLDEFKSKKRCSIIGFVPQSFALFPHMSILDNCAHPLRFIFKEKKRPSYEKAKDILRSLDMENFINVRPYQLSCGQQQRAAIARALMLTPLFLLFDEPTSALDPENTELFLQIIKKIKNDGKGIIISTQDMAFAAKILDCAIFLEKGSVIESYDLKNSPDFLDQSKIRQFLKGSHHS